MRKFLQLPRQSRSTTFPRRYGRQEREPLEDDTETGDVEDVEMPAFEARSAGGKGLGLFASGDIMAGERLI